MVILDYVSSLLPSVQRTRVEEDLRVLKEELNEATLPPYKQLDGYFSEVPFRSTSVKDFDSLYQREVKPKRSFSGHYVSSLYKILTHTQTILSTIEETVMRSFGQQNATVSITYSKANQLRLIEILYFVYQYSRKLLLWTIHNEMENAHAVYGKPLNNAESAWMFEHRRAFFNAVSTLQLKPEEVKWRLEAIPDLEVIPEEAKVAEQTQSMRKLDAFETHLIPIKLNPIYHIRMAVVEFQAARHQAAMEERKLLEYRLLALKDLRAGKTDARLEQQILYTENRLKKLNYKLKTYEEE